MCCITIRIVSWEKHTVLALVNKQRLCDDALLLYLQRAQRSFFTFRTDPCVSCNSNLARVRRERVSDTTEQIVFVLQYQCGIAPVGVVCDEDELLLRFWLRSDQTLLVLATNSSFKSMKYLVGTIIPQVVPVVKIKISPAFPRHTATWLVRTTAGSDSHGLSRHKMDCCEFVNLRTLRWFSCSEGYSDWPVMKTPPLFYPCVRRHSDGQSQQPEDKSTTLKNSMAY